MGPKKKGKGKIPHGMRCTLESSARATDVRSACTCVSLIIRASFISSHFTPCRVTQPSSRRRREEEEQIERYISRAAVGWGA